MHPPTLLLAASDELQLSYDLGAGALLGIAAVAVGALLALIIGAKLHPLLALVIVSIGTAFARASWSDSARSGRRWPSASRR